MDENNAIILADFKDGSLSTLLPLNPRINAAAEQARHAILIGAGQVQKVESPQEQATAIVVQQSMAGLTREIETARKDLTGPLLKAKKDIDQACKDFLAPVEDEEARVSGLINDYMTLQLAKQRAQEHVRTRILTQMDMARQQALAACKSLDEMDAVNAQFDEQARGLKPVEEIRVEGQVVREDWDIKVVDVWALARAHPMCVKIEPRLKEIKELLDLGLKVHGVEAVKAVKSGVRRKPEQAVLEIGR